MNRRLIALTAAALVLLGALAAWGVLCASVVRVRRCELYLEDLPKAFSGTKILYAADFDLMGEGSGDKTKQLFDQVAELAPDLVLLGGDYFADPLVGGDIDRLYELDRFFSAFEGYRPALGMYGLLAGEEEDQVEINALMRRYGIVPMRNNIKKLEKNGEQMYLLGFGETYKSPKGAVAAEDCVIGFAYDSDCAVQLSTEETEGGGALLDVLLTGGAKDGQIRLPFKNRNIRFPSGWQNAGDTQLLVTTGVGCEKLPLRFGTKGEVWLITLYQKEA